MRRTGREAKGIPRFAQVMRNREYLGLWLAEALSIAGDQLAKVALAILVYDRTGSPLWSAVVYAMTFLPALFGGLGLSQLADRYPRRTLHVACLLMQAALVGVMAIPGMHLVALCLLVFMVSTLNAPANAAQHAITREVFDNDAEYLRSQDLRGIMTNTMMLLGLAIAGVLVTTIGVSWALLIDAITFLVAATLIRFMVHWRPAAGDPEDGWFDGARLVATDPRLRVLFGMAALVGLTIVPEGLAAPLADQLGAPKEAVGLLLAADPLGFVIGAFVFSHYVSADTRLRLIGPLAAMSAAVLIGFAIHPSLLLALALLALSGAAGAYILTIVAAVNTWTPNGYRGAVGGVFSTGLRVAQGMGVGLGGAVAVWINSTTGTIVLFSAVATVLALILAVRWARLIQPAAEPTDSAVLTPAVTHSSQASSSSPEQTRSDTKTPSSVTEF